LPLDKTNKKHRRNRIVLKSKSDPIFLQRSRFDIMACILENSNASSRKTRLIYKCNLSLSQFNFYRGYLLKAGFLKASKRKDGAEIFETTEKGEEFLKGYRKISRILQSGDK